MNFGRRIEISIFAALFSVPATAALGQDASFGCKVLLCAASSNPSWSGIPYCAPVMQQLFHDLAKGGNWPTCPEGATSGIAYQPYQQCSPPFENYSPTQSGQSNGEAFTLTSDANGSVCANPTILPAGCTWTVSPTDAGKQGGACSIKNTYLQTTAATANADPYYVTITPQGAPPIKLWFNLNGLQD